MRTRPPPEPLPLLSCYTAPGRVLPVTGPSVTFLPLHLVVFKSFLVMPRPPFPQPLRTSHPGQKASQENSAPLISTLGPPALQEGPRKTGREPGPRSSETAWSAGPPSDMSQKDKPERLRSRLLSRVSDGRFLARMIS